MIATAKHVQQDFSGADLRKASMAFQVYDRCKFDKADMSNANCEGTQFIACTFRQTICYRTNFKDAKLGACVFEPADAFGITVTLECGTFQNMKTSQQWFLCWLLLATLMLPDERRPVPVNFRELLIGVIGAERFVRLQALFSRREL